MILIVAGSKRIPYSEKDQTTVFSRPLTTIREILCPVFIGSGTLSCSHLAPSNQASTRANSSCIDAVELIQIQ